MTDRIPEGFELTRTTPVFGHDTVPAGLLEAHRVANGVWGRLVVHAGEVGFVFEDTPGSRLRLVAGDSVVIPPARLHHVELDQSGRFCVEFYRPPGAPSAGEDGPPSTGLDPST